MGLVWFSKRLYRGSNSERLGACCSLQCRSCYVEAVMSSFALRSLLSYHSSSLWPTRSEKIGQRQIDLARRWNQDGLLSDAGLKAVIREQ